MELLFWVSAVIYAIAVAGLILGVIVLAALGFNLLRSAFAHRGEGWMCGAGLGAFVLITSVGGTAAMAIALLF